MNVSTVLIERLRASVLRLSGSGAPWLNILTVFGDAGVKVYVGIPALQSLINGRFVERVLRADGIYIRRIMTPLFV